MKIRLTKNNDLLLPVKMARKHIFCNIDSTYSIVFFSLLFNRAIIRFCVLDEFFANSEVLLLLFVSFLLPGYASGCTVEVARYCLSNIKHIWYYVKQRHTKNVCAQYLVNDVLKCCTPKIKKKHFPCIFVMRKIHHFYYIQL